METLTWVKGLGCLKCENDAVRMIAEQPARIDLAMAKRVLAAELSTVSETLSRSLAEFR